MLGGGARGRGGRHSSTRTLFFVVGSDGSVSIPPRGGGVAAWHSPLLLISWLREAEVARREAEAAVKRTRG